jgi:hypothetical protein
VGTAGGVERLARGAELVAPRLTFEVQTLQSRVRHAASSAVDLKRPKIGATSSTTCKIRQFPGSVNSVLSKLWVRHNSWDQRNRKLSSVLSQAAGH